MTTKLTVIIVACMALLIACQPLQVQQQAPDLVPAPGTAQAGQGIIKFKDIDDLRNFVQQRGLLSGNDGRMFKGGIARFEAVSAEVASSDSGAPRAAPAPSGGTDYSETNVQVAGVDEADFVKTDGDYIYIVKDNRFIVVDARDPVKADIIGEIDMQEDRDDYSTWSNARDLFIDGDKAYVFVEGNEPYFYFQQYDIRPIPSYKSVTRVQVIDLSDKEKPSIEKTIRLPGGYFQSRLTDGHIYAVTQESVFNGPVIYEPLVKVGANTIHPELFYFDNPEENYQFNTVTSIGLASQDVVESKSFMMGYANTLMMSQDNIFIAYQKQQFWRCRWCYDETQYEKTRFFDVIYPELPAELRNDIDAVRGGEEDEEWKRISDALQAFFADLEGDDDAQRKYQETFEDLDEKLAEYDAKLAADRSKTVIHKIAIDDGKLEYKGRGEVSGSLLNQFSMDEFDGKLRVATTVNVWTDRQVQYNNVYVLDGDLKVTGSLEKIAPQEQIFSARFLGDRLYLVTFRRTDPFFVIDLSGTPRILGELKIPGFSDYLHPYDEDHIIGIGKETEEYGDDRVEIKGVKVALFDVGDVKNPKLVDKVEIGDAGSDSAALHDHKAFLFSKERNLLVLPMTEITRRDKSTWYGSIDKVWHGAYMFRVTEDGIDTLATVEHSSGRGDNWYWYGDTTVQRSLYIDDALYTLSDKYLKATDLRSYEQLGSVRLPVRKDYPVPYYGGDVIAVGRGVSEGSAGSAVAVPAPATPPIAIE